MRWAVYKWIYLPGDSAEVRETKRKLVMLLAVLIVIIPMTVADIAGDAFSVVRVAPSLLYAFAAALTLVWMLRVKTVLSRLIALLTVVFCLAVILGDLWRLSLGTSSLYAHFVIVLDFLLVFRAPLSYSQAVVAVMVIWMIASGLEDAYPWGLYDLPSLPSQEQRRMELPETCDKLPCPKNPRIVVVTYATRTLIIFSDYLFTRDFATRLFAEQAARDRSADAVRDIARHISRFNLGPAHEQLAASVNSLPPDLVASLRDILTNLEDYRRYLPRSCLPQNDDDHEGAGDLGDSSVGFDESWSENKLSASEPKGPASDDDGPGTPTRGAKRKAPAPGQSLRLCHSSPGASLRFAAVSVLRIVAVFDHLVAGNAAVLACRLSRLVESALHAAEWRKGIIDLLEGDSIFVSFNAARHCTRHCVHAVNTSVALSSEHSARPRPGARAGGVGGALLPPMVVYDLSLSSSDKYVRSRRASTAAAARCNRGAGEADAAHAPKPGDSVSSSGTALRVGVGVDAPPPGRHEPTPDAQPAKDAPGKVNNAWVPGTLQLPADAAAAVTSQRGAGEDACLSVYYAVASGRALCGDVGCAEVQRFGVIGLPSALSATLSWLGRSWDISIVCDVAVQREVMHFHETAMLPRTVRAPFCEAPVTVYEVLPKEQKDESNPEEWMYELRDVGAWDGYNDAVESFLKGDRGAAERQVAAAAGVASGRTGAYFARFKQFMAAHGAPPPPVDPRPVLAWDPVDSKVTNP
ncbi:hypothetical protein DIPPA_00506 [Diplonema papillatum]|nr:hypothetical protein DIPPA_00506 [Diplonema papillatum]